MLKLILPYFFLITFAVPQFGQSNFRIFPSSVTQTEPVIAISKSDPPIFFASAVTINTSNAFRSEGVYVSTNYGLNWFGSDTCKGQLLSNHGGDPGVVITTNNKLLLTHIGSVFPGNYSHYSDNLGATWSNAYTITNQQTDDKGTLAIDDNLNSPYFGRIYSLFVKMISPYPIHFSYSDNNGESWTNPTIINNQPPARCTGPSIVIDNDGKIFVAWAAITAQAPFYEDYIGFASSSNGGETWAVVNNIFDVNGITGTLQEKGNIRVNGLPRMVIDKSNSSRKGWLYIFTSEKNIHPAGADPDIIMHRSTNVGLSWSDGIRVNQDDLNNGKIQYFPAAEIDEQGNLYVIYYDDRNTTSDSAEVFISISSDGGEHWRDEILSDHRFKPKPVIGGSSNYQGDYISLISHNKKLYALWMDDYSGVYQIWMKIKNIEPSSVNFDFDVSSKSFRLEQNYPNPFNPSTKIKFTIQALTPSPSPSERVILRVYDILGKEAAKLVDEEKPAGSYEVEFKSADDNLQLTSGVYFYQLKVGDYLETKKMIFLR